MKTIRVLEENLCNLFAVLMSLCDSYVKNHVESNTYSDLEKELNSMKLLAMFKKVVYTGGTHDLNVQNKAYCPYEFNESLPRQISRHTRMQRSIHG